MRGRKTVSLIDAENGKDSGGLEGGLAPFLAVLCAFASLREPTRFARRVLRQGARPQSHAKEKQETLRHNLTRARN
jgi:hypothetical protein